MPIPRRDVPWLAGAIAFGGVLGPVLLMVGLRTTPGAAASLLLNLEGVFTAALAWFVFRENYDRRIAAGMLLIVAGGVVLSWQPGQPFSVSTGALAVAGACLCWGIDNNMTQKVSAGDPVTIAALKGGVAGAINAVIAWAIGAGLPGGSAIAGALVLGLVSYGASLALYVLALRHVGTARTGAYFSVAPFAGALLSLAVLREPVGGPLVAAGVLMAAGVWLHLTERHAHKHHHDRMSHSHSHRHIHDEHHQHAHEPGIDPREPHTHWHEHEPLVHAHPHYPDIHHRHRH
jgi:drug/metabolite transporter (DMT)-like permease